MLFKLMKYDLRACLRTLLPVWAATFLMSIVCCLLERNDMALSGLSEFLLVILPIIVLSLLFAASFAIAAVFMVRSFWKGLLGHEGYLMFTLPVSTGALVASKALSALIIEILTLVAAAVCGVMMTVFLNSWQVFSSSLREIWPLVQEGLREHPDTVPSILLFCLGCIFWMLSLNLHTYLACSIGHLANRGRKLLTVVAFCAVSIAFGYGSGVISDLLSPFEFSNIGFSAFFAAAPLALCALYFFLTQLILARRLNLE